MTDMVRSGVFLPLEREADAWILGSLKGVTSQSAKSDILTPWKEQDRRSREVYSRSGSVDPQIRRGMYHRSANESRPHLNSREGIAPPQRAMNSPIASLTTPDGGHYYDGPGEWS